MKEIELRKYHRTIGVILTLFIFIQVGSGILMSISEITKKEYHMNIENNQKGEKKESPLTEIIHFFHHEAGITGGIFRVILGIGILFLNISGCIIFFKTKKRSKK